jgi:periplasmic copper chaperone A
MKMRYLGAAATLFASSVVCAWAHVTAQPNEAAADSYFLAAFSVPHGCDGSATVALRMKIPDGVTSVKPQMKAGWEVGIKTRKLDKPAAAGHGAPVDETVDQVAWRGGPLPDNLFDTFGLIMKFPDAPGQTLYFPVIQECVQGVHRWIEIPTGQQTWEGLREPAPFLRLKPKTP